MDGGIHPACGRGVGPGWLLLHSDRKMRSGSRGVGGASIPPPPLALLPWVVGESE